MTDKRPPAEPASTGDILLPWYVNGTLSETEMDRVSREVEASAQLAGRVEEEIRLAKQWRDEPAEIEQLLAAEDAACRQLLEQLPRRPARSNPITWYAAAAVLCVGIGVASLFSVLLGEKGGGEYQTLTNPAPGGVVLQVIFQPSTTEREIRTLLLDGDARLLSGPTQQGVYRLVLPPHIDGAHYAERLQQHPAIRWAELEAP